MDTSSTGPWPGNQQRSLIVNADDFGFTRDVNEGIIASHKHGILTATTLMATGREFRHAVELSKGHPKLDIGCHLVLVQGPNQPPNILSLLKALTLKRIDPRKEFARQIEILLKAGVRPSHLDTHKHTHLVPAVLDAVLRVSEEFTIPWVRKPQDFSRDASAPLSQQITASLMRLALRKFDSKLAGANGRRTDSFTGFQLTGRMTAANLSATLKTLPLGVTELMCHPGFLSGDLARATTRLKQSRADEYSVLCSPEVRTVLLQNQIQLTTYRDL